MSRWFRTVSVLSSVACLSAALLGAQMPKDQVRVETGTLEGTTNAGRDVRIFKGVPFAAPPVGDLRWKASRPPLPWSGVRQADKFASACLQTNVFGDIYFRDAQPSEDCLNLNIWIPAKAGGSRLPVLVWYYGGGFVAGANSEPRYDGENLAKKGIIVVEPNYRLGVFGYYSHPELSKESGHNSSGNYGLLDQVAALQWVVKNIAAFGGDSNNITIAGESAGSLSVSALMASPLSRNLFQRAMGESGAFFPLRKDVGHHLKPRAETEELGVKFAESLGATTIAQMRAKPAEELLEEAAKHDRGFDFWPNVDGYYLPADVQTIFAEGQQSHVPLLAGWNADENRLAVLLAPQKTTAKSFAEQARTRFGDDAGAFLKLYPAATDEEALASAEALAGDDFIAFSTWKWIDTQRKTANQIVFQYLFAQVPAYKPDAKIGPLPAADAGARHAGEIEYVFETLKSSQPDTPWTDGDFRVSEAMAAYWTNFVKTGNPNGNGLPDWPASNQQNQHQVLHLSGKGIRASADSLRARYEFLDTHPAKTQVARDGTQ